MRIEKYVRSQIRLILEQEEKEKSFVTVGPGGGRWSKLVRDTRSRADTEPEALLKDLGIEKGVAKGTTDQTLAAAVNSARSNEFFEAAFGTPNKSIDAVGREGWTVEISEISTRDALKYLSILTKALRMTGILGAIPKGSFHIERFVDGRNEIVFYEAQSARSWGLSETERGEGDLLLEPDLSNEDERANPKYDVEVSSGGVAGVALPLGASSNPPKNKK